jgi:hypothetical protein
MPLEVQQGGVRSVGEHVSRDALQRDALGEHLPVARAARAGLHVFQRRIAPHLLDHADGRDVQARGWIGCDSRKLGELRQPG